MSIWISLEGGMEKVNSVSHELQSASLKLVPRPMIQSAVRHFSLMNLVPQKPVMPSTSGLASESTPLPISEWATGMPI